MSAKLPERPPVLAGLTHVRTLGRGGFADVFLFEQNMPRRSVAVKVLHHNVVDENVLRMFNAEADVMARLSAHPSIVTVHDASISADGRPYLVMELCPGSMGARYRSEVIPVPEVLHAGVKIASALETAVREGILHRDVKPSNVLTTSFGSPVLADFGIATALGTSEREDFSAMSVPWSAPEVVEERTTGTVTSEVWALGATLYTLLAGRTPFEVAGAGRNTREQLVGRISRAKYVPTGRADVPPRLEQLLAKTMQREPSRRPQTLLEVAIELQAVQQELGMMPTPLEVAAEGWSASTAGGTVDFSDASVRGPVISRVAVDSKRRPREATAERTMTDDDFFRADAGPPRKSRFGLTAILIVGGVLVLLGVGALVAAIVVGGA
jgi:serine/threonine protein kinase